MGSVEVAVTWQGSQCEGVQARLAAWLTLWRLLSSGGKVLGEEEKAAENIYIKVEITYRGRQLLPILTLQHVRDIMGFDLIVG
ncbi:Os07g0278866 [Oryza sativa Japonica Group]|uniref:Os07g0278866 protein n=1 Tax=Oryza sativa subsp. japonica TaxID=39947 RepID=C7J4S0_ORYSJ|nr:Os07g0278866 [Oryza sativa Japonica Group]|eukprot:NP_001175139.1 Os07g0278866 [Oryza sativa Japonica Group]